MGKYFGTDGIRGVAGEFLDARLAYLTGFAAATVVGRGKSSGKLRAVIGKDTRVSSDMLEAALISGLCSGGADAEPVGIVPTPAVAFLTMSTGADMGIMISASHNSFEHNGIKIFGSEGMKLTDMQEAEIEALIASPDSLTAKTHAEMGVVKSREKAVDAYINRLAKLIDGDFSGMKIALDCANGSAAATARRLFSKLGARLKIIGNRPDGVNINDGCGSMHMEALCKVVTRGKFDIGIAFDGDADRCLAIDERGEIIDGDVILSVLARDLKKQGRLRGNAIVGTILTNSGVEEFCRREEISLLRTDVGDRRILELMLRDGYVIGGEGSGHTIMLEHSTTGDGQLTAIMLLNLLAKSGVSASQLALDVPKYPHVEINVTVSQDDKKRRMEHPALHAAISEASRSLGGEGSVLVRPSGTESLIRVTIEAKTQELATDMAKQLADIVLKL